MKKFSIILSSAYPILVFLMLTGLLSQTAGIYQNFFTHTLDGVALPALTEFFSDGNGHRWRIHNLTGLAFRGNSNAHTIRPNQKANRTAITRSA